MTLAKPEAEALEARLHALEDRHSIADVLHRYCRALDRLDAALLRDVFFEDAELDYGPGLYRGPPGPFIPFAIGFQSAMRHTQHRLTNLLIERKGDRAFCESYVCAIHQLERDGELLDLIVDGRFLDGFEMRHGGWRIARRVEVIDFAHERLSTSHWFEQGPELHRGRHGMDDLLAGVRGEWLSS